MQSQSRIWFEKRTMAELVWSPVSRSLFAAGISKRKKERKRERKRERKKKRKRDREKERKKERKQEKEMISAQMGI